MRPKTFSSSSILDPEEEDGSEKQTASRVRCEGAGRGGM